MSSQVCSQYMLSRQWSSTQRGGPFESSPSLRSYCCCCCSPRHLKMPSLTTVLLCWTALFAITVCAFPANMNREKCTSDGIYWRVQAGDMIPCSPTCDEVYHLTDKNDVSSKTIRQHCQLNTSVGKHYHDIANHTMCVCTNGAAYKSVSSIDWTSISEVTQWFCIPASKWNFQPVGSNTYRVVCL